ncbi:hypothetical protein P9H32_09105 [Pontiella sp. NLcol2]|uniref:Uncharacterized protein n=1 Tax=Pontiella agarivorans TaxID=3038953 RepID=A0ABU5MXI5_9BACT|nr:hypothetical protein [Pontiella agarivorans]
MKNESGETGKHFFGIATTQAETNHIHTALTVKKSAVNRRFQGVTHALKKK